MSRKPVIVHVHSGLVELWLVTHPRRLFARAGLAPAARVLTASAASCTPLRNAVGSKALLIDNGVNVSSFSPGVPRHHRPTVLYAGLLTPRKGVIDLLEASTLLAESGVEHQLLLAGGTPDEGPEAEEQVRRAAEGRATLIGAVAHEAMAELYGRVDVFCLPSWWEAMPLSVLEAMAAGLPVVATRVGDTPRAVTDGVTGRLVSRKDPRALAEALRPLLLDADLRTRMGAAGREAVEARFDVSTMYSKLGAIYTQVISQHGKHKHGPFMSGRPGPGTGPV